MLLFIFVARTVGKPAVTIQVICPDWTNLLWLNLIDVYKIGPISRRRE